ncbi:hypothetical protein LXL04_012561 [Taraxacum kok-saghyz]
MNSTSKRRRFGVCSGQSFLSSRTRVGYRQLLFQVLLLYLSSFLSPGVLIIQTPEYLSFVPKLHAFSDVVLGYSSCVPDLFCIVYLISSSRRSVLIPQVIGSSHHSDSLSFVPNLHVFIDVVLSYSSCVIRFCQ